MDTTTIIMTVISGLLGGGFIAFLQFMITRHDKKHDKQGEILKAIEKLSGEVEAVKADAEQRDAIMARTHILRFRDELYNNMKHTQEYFDQTMDDIEVYDQFCADHPDFANGRTKAASRFINEEYNRLFKEHKL